MSIDPAVEEKLNDLFRLQIPLITAEGPSKGKIDETALLAKFEAIFPKSRNGDYAKQITAYYTNELQTKDVKERVYVIDADGTIANAPGKDSYPIFRRDRLFAELYKSLGKAAPADLSELGDQPGPATMKVDGVSMQVEVQTPNGEARLKPFGMPFLKGRGYGEITSINGRNAASLPDHDSNGVGEQLDIFLGSGDKPGARFYVFSQTTKDKTGAKKFDEPKVVIATSMEEAQRLYAETWADKAKAAKNYTAVTEMTGAQFTKWTAALDEASKGLKGADGKVPVGEDGKPLLTPAYLAVADAAQWGAQDGNAVSVFKQPAPAASAKPVAVASPVDDFKIVAKVVSNATHNKASKEQVAAIEALLGDKANKNSVLEQIEGTRALNLLSGMMGTEAGKKQLHELVDSLKKSGAVDYVQVGPNDNTPMGNVVAGTSGIAKQR